jgi:hypothetical protein
MLRNISKKLKWWIGLGSFLFFISPIIVNTIVIFEPPFGITVMETNDWIGFFGNFLGGLVTVVGLIVTILYTNYQYKDQDRKRILPYFRIIQFQKDEALKIDKKKYKLGIHAGLAGIKVRPNDIYFKKIEFYGEIKNIGLGNAIDIGIKDLQLENKILKTKDLIVLSSYTPHILEVGEDFNFEISLSEVLLEERFFTTVFLKAHTNYEQKKTSDLPKIKFSFNLTFKDLLGNTYNQIVTTYLQIDHRNNEEVKYFYYNGPFFERIDFPQLKK